jgi:hypothetical protein
MPTVHVTLGTIWNPDYSVFIAVLDGLADKPMNIVITLGPGADPDTFGPRPATFTSTTTSLTHSYWAAAIWSSATAARARRSARSHSGCLSCSSLRQPTISTMPRGWSLREQVVRCLARKLTAEVVATEVRLLMEDTNSRTAATAIAAQIAAMPAASAAVPALEGLVT